MKLYSCWKPNYKCITLIFNPQDPCSKEIGVASLSKDTRYWGRKNYDDYGMYAFGLYFFELCYYA